MRRARLILLFTMLIAACMSDNLSGPRLSPRIEDGAHNDGNRHFYFLPPMVPQPAYEGVFDPNQQPVVEICALDAGACTGPLVARFETQGPFDDLEGDNDQGTRPEHVRVSPGRKFYRVRWHTREYLLNSALTYRITVRVGAATLGFADVDLVDNGSQLRNVNTGEYVPLLDGRTLPIKFRIEQGAVLPVAPGGSVSVGPAGGTVASTDGEVGLVIPAGALPAATAISVAPISEPPEGLESWAPAVDLGPDGTAFAEPVTLTLAYDPAQLPEGALPQDLEILTFDGTGWVAVEGSVSHPEQATVSAPISHFSYYTISFRPNQITGSTSSLTLSVGQTTNLQATVSYTSCTITCRTYRQVNRAVNWHTNNLNILDLRGTTYTNTFGVATSPPLLGRGAGNAIAVAEVILSRGLWLNTIMTVTVVPPLSLADYGTPAASRTLGVHQVFGLDVLLPWPAPASVVATLTLSGPGIAADAVTVTIPAGQTTAQAIIEGRIPGTDTVIVTAPGYGPDTMTIDVGTGRIGVEGLPPTIAFGESVSVMVRSLNPVTSAFENTRNVRFALAGTPNLRFSDGTQSVSWLTVPDMASGAAVWIVAIGPGAGTVDITSPNFIPFQAAVDVAGQPLSFAQPTATIVAGWSVGLDFGVPIAMPADVPVSLANLNGFLVVGESGTSNYTYGGQTGTYVLPAGATSKHLVIAGLGGPGTDTLVISGPGLLPDTAIIEVILGRLRVNGWPSALQVGDSAVLEVTVSDPNTGANGNLAYPISVTLDPGTGLVFTDGSNIITALPIQQRTSAPFYVKAVAAGTPSVTLSHADYEPYTHTITTSGQPVINPFPQAGQQFVLPVLAGTPGTGTAPISNAGTGVLGGLQVVGTPYICTSGQPLPWLSFAFDSPTAPTNLRVTASVPAGTALGIYDFCFTLRATGAADRSYGVRVSVQQVVVPNPPIIDPFPQGRTQHSITTLAGGIGSRVVPVGNSGGSPLTGLTLAGPVINCANGQPVTWLSHSWSSTTAPASLTLTATPPGSTPPGTYELCFELQARAAGAMDKHYGVNVIVQPPLVGARSVCNHDVTGIGYDGTYYYVGEGHNGLFQCLSRFNAATGILHDTRIVPVDHRGVHWVPALGRVTSRSWGGFIYSIDIATGQRTGIATNPTASRPGDEQSAPAVDPDGQSYWILTNGVAERRRLSDHGLLTSFPVTANSGVNSIAVSDMWVFVLDGAGVNGYSKVSGQLAGRQPLPFPHGCGNYGFGASVNADRLMILRDCRTVEIVPVTVTFSDPGWTTLAPLPTPRISIVGGMINGRLYVAGGYQGSNVTGILEEYNPVTNTWTRRADMPTPRGNHAGAVLNGKLYVVGGGGQQPGALGTLEMYDPATDSWTTLAPMPVGRYYTAAAALNGRLYVFGGATGLVTPFEQSAVDRVDIYDPATDTWSTGAPMLARRYTMSAAAVGNVIYLVGGYGSLAGYQDPLAVVDAYDTQSNSWISRAPVPQRRGQAPALAVLNGLLYAAGGFCFNCGNSLSTMEVYDPATNAWSGLPPMVYGRWGAVTGVLSGQIYVAGGHLEGASPTSALERFHP